MTAEYDQHNNSHVNRTELISEAWEFKPPQAFFKLETGS